MQCKPERAIIARLTHDWRFPMSRVFAAVLCFAFSSTAFAGEPKGKGDKVSADKLLADGLARAKKESKAIFLHFSSPT